MRTSWFALHYLLRAHYFFVCHASIITIRSAILVFAAAAASAVIVILPFVVATLINTTIVKTKNMVMMRRRTRTRTTISVISNDPTKINIIDFVASVAAAVAFVLIVVAAIRYYDKFMHSYASHHYLL